MVIDKDRLDVDLLKVELLSALTSMKNGKSLDVDGLLCEFFREMRDTVGDDLCCMANEALFGYTNGLSQPRVNQANSEEHDHIGGWRPISLLIIPY
jgi:hypothetical protein